MNRTPCLIIIMKVRFNYLANHIVIVDLSGSQGRDVPMSRSISVSRKAKLSKERDIVP